MINLHLSAKTMNNDLINVWNFKVRLYLSYQCIFNVCMYVCMYVCIMSLSTVATDKNTISILI